MSEPTMLPHNMPAEEAVLGSILVTPDSLLKVAQILDPSVGMFYREKHNWIYAAMARLHEARTPLDHLTLCDELERAGQLAEIGGPAYLAGLINATPTSIHVEHYARIVARTYRQRALIDASGKISKLAWEGGESMDQVMADAEHALFNVTTPVISDRAMSIEEAVGAHYERIEQIQQGQPLGVPTGYQDLDKLLRGLHKGELILLAARPSVGKTSLAVNIVHRAARAGARCALFSLEMSSHSIVNRLLALACGLGVQDLRDGNLGERAWPKYLKGCSDLTKLPIHIDDSPMLTPATLRAKARRLYAEYGLDLLVVDYLQQMAADASGGNRQQEMAEISRHAKALARELNIPLLALSQLSRGVEARTDKRPVLSDLRESGALEQDADVVIFLYREEMYFPDSKAKGYTEAIVAKHREGPTGTIGLSFQAATCRFEPTIFGRQEPLDL